MTATEQPAAMKVRVITAEMPQDPELPDHPLAETVYAECFGEISQLRAGILAQLREETLCRGDLDPDIRALLIYRVKGEYPREKTEVALAHLRTRQRLDEHDRLEAARQKEAEVVAALLAERAQREQGDGMVNSTDNGGQSPFQAGRVIDPQQHQEVPSISQLRDRRRSLIQLMASAQLNESQQQALRRLVGIRRWNDLALEDPDFDLADGMTEKARVVMRSVIRSVQSKIEQFAAANATPQAIPEAKGTDPDNEVPRERARQERERVIRSIRRFRGHPRLSEFPVGLRQRLRRPLETLNAYDGGRLLLQLEAAEAALASSRRPPDPARPTPRLLARSRPPSAAR